jgi:adenosine deaminase
MGSSELDLATLPKVELHVHLEGTVSAATASELARRRGDDPAEVLVLEGDVYPPRFDGFEHFLRTFLATSAQVRTPDDLAHVAAAFARAQAAQRVVWTEATFTAVTMVQRGMEPGPMWRALSDGFAEAPDTHVRLIVDTPRDLPLETSHETVRLVEAALTDGAPICALGLTGIEGSRHESEFVHLREAADRLGLGLVVHAGEMGTAENVRATLDHLRPDRVAHGIAALADPDLVARLVREAVVLDVCPSSNVTLGLVAALDAHPLRALSAAGVAFTIGSDDPPFFSTTLTDELGHATRLLALTGRGIADLQRRALAASFAPDELRRDVAARIDAWDAETSA